ncbi:tetratricopeptide repeat protein [Acinetobacter junii]|uniref:tetratricopeptide repeat protein n=1 Tax=Acinetobacter junii TaxID=40215 RepID=UPI0024B676EE|nr:tetratricopeptide repeat protein [Acinetobacter junii]MDI9721260.1 tetratricopeptide repeat protein [Acinetobacter junii]
MNKLMLNLVVATSIIAASSTVFAETKKVNLSAGLNYLLSQVATKGNNNQSNHNTGMLYYLGKNGVPLDHKKAAEWFSKAATKGYAPSQYALSVMYLNGDGVPQDAEKGVALLQSAARQGQPDAVKMYNSLQARVQQLNTTQTASVQTSITAIKYYDTSTLEPKNFKQVVVPNLSIDTIARSFYKVTSSRERKQDDYWGNGKYYFVNFPEPNGPDFKAVISIAPILNYQNLQKEDRYLVGVERAKVFDNGADTSHASVGYLDLYLFKKLDNGQFQLVSKTEGNGISGFYGYGKTWWNDKELKKNLQPMGKNVMGSYTIDDHYGNGFSESYWVILLLNEDDYIVSAYIPEGMGSTDEPEYGYSSSIKVIKNEKPFYSIDAHYQGTDMNDKKRIIKVNRTSRYDYTPHGEDYYTKQK